MAKLANRTKIQNKNFQLDQFIFYITRKCYKIIILLILLYLIYFFTPQIISNLIFESIEKIKFSHLYINSNITTSFKWITNHILYFKNINRAYIKLYTNKIQLEKAKKHILDVQKKTIY